MTISEAMLQRLEARGLDVELADRLGLATMRRGDGEALVLPFVREGRVVRRKYRRFDAGDGVPKWSADKDGQRIAFNEDCLRDESLLGQPLIITEGEFDAMAALQSGFARTISVPDGAPPPGDGTRTNLRLAPSTPGCATCCRCCTRTGSQRSYSPPTVTRAARR